MNKKNTNYLLKNYKSLYKEYYLPMTQTCLCWGFDFLDGWFGLLDKLSIAITVIERKNKGLKVYCTQCKEKFGTLRWYYRLEAKKDFELSVYNEIENAIRIAENESSKTCEVCGKPGKLYSKGWCKVRCNKCFRKETNGK